MRSEERMGLKPVTEIWAYAADNKACRGWMRRSDRIVCSGNVVVCLVSWCRRNVG